MGGQVLSEPRRLVVLDRPIWGGPLAEVGAKPTRDPDEALFPVQGVVAATQAVVEAGERGSQRGIGNLGAIHAVTGETCREDGGVEVRDSLDEPGARGRPAVMDHVRRQDGDSGWIATPVVVLEVISDAAVVDDDDCPRVMVVRRVTVGDELGVKDLRDTGEGGPPSFDSLLSGLPGHVTNVQDSRVALGLTPSMEPVWEDHKVAVVVRDDLAVWQKLNVTAFVTSGIGPTRPDFVGDPYEDASGVKYLPMLGLPILVFVADTLSLRRAFDRALARDLQVAVYTEDLFATGNDVDNRAAVRAVATDGLALVGFAVAGERRTVDRALDKLKLHP